MSWLNAIHWELVALTSFCVINLLLASSCYLKLRRIRAKQHAQKRYIRELEDDVKTLYESANTLGNKVQAVEHASKVLKEQQEQLTLKEPNQQTYRNAIQAINNGESVSQIADQSGLSRGEVELLTLLQKINSNDNKQAANTNP